MRYKCVTISRGGDQVSAKDGKIGKWKQGAWTPDRCAIWQALPADRRTAFEEWVGKEPEFNYDAQVSAEWQAEADKAGKAE